jgi:hypothetical protein
VRKLIPTLTQSGLLAVLLQRQRYKVIQLAQRRAHRKHTRAALWNALTWLLARAHGANTIDDSAEPFGERSRSTLKSFTRRIIMFHQIHTYTELQQQIHDDLRIQHPEWVESNGECPRCDSYEALLTEMLDTLTRTGSNGSIAATHRALEQGLN